MRQWPASMRRTTAAEYLDISGATFDRISNNIPSIQYTERGDRYWLKEDLDAYLESRRRLPVTPRNQ